MINYIYSRFRDGNHQSWLITYTQGLERGCYRPPSTLWGKSPFISMSAINFIYININTLHLHNCDWPNFLYINANTLHLHNCDWPLSPQAWLTSICFHGHYFSPSIGCDFSFHLKVVMWSFNTLICLSKYEVITNSIKHSYFPSHSIFLIIFKSRTQPWT